MLATRVGHAEPAPIEIEVAGFRVTHVDQACAVTNVCARPQFTKALAVGEESVDQFAQPRIVEIASRDIAELAHHYVGGLVPIEIELPGGGVLTVIAGMVVLGWPISSIVALAIIAGAWLVVIGAIQVVGALSARSKAKKVERGIESLTPGAVG